MQVGRAHRNFVWFELNDPGQATPLRGKGLKTIQMLTDGCSLPTLIIFLALITTNKNFETRQPPPPDGGYFLFIFNKNNIFIVNFY